MPFTVGKQILVWIDGNCEAAQGMYSDAMKA